MVRKFHRASLVFGAMPKDLALTEETTMKTSKTMMAMLAAAAICTSPAYANWFSNPSTNTNLNIGSAPNPTPADLQRTRAAIPHSNGHYGEPARLSSNYYEPTVLTFTAQPASYETGSTVLHRMTDEEMTALEGKPVLGQHGARLGYILAVDHDSHMAEIQTPSGIGVGVSTMLLADKGNHIIAPTMAKADMMAMAKTQTGRTVATNIDMRDTFRG